MRLITEPYLTQVNHWPKTGRQILPQYDDQSIVVYQAHDPSGAKLERRAIQLGLRGKVLAAYARHWIVNIENISEFVSQQRQNIHVELMTPRELVYPVFETEIDHKLEISQYPLPVLNSCYANCPIHRNLFTQS